MQKTHAFLLALLILVIGSIVIVAMYFVNGKSNIEDRFSVSGIGTVYAKADIANISIGIKTEAKKTPAEATKESADKMNAVIYEIKKLEIDEKDIKTSNYALNPVYNWTQNKGQELIGYEISQTIDIKVRNLEKIGDVISKTTEKGANQIGNINFTIDDEFVLKNQAREMAIEKAKEKAFLIAKKTDMELGRITNAYENIEPIQYQPYINAKMELEGRGANDSVVAPQIQTGQNEVKIEIILIYEVK